MKVYDIMASIVYATGYSLPLGNPYNSTQVCVISLSANLCHFYHFVCSVDVLCEFKYVAHFKHHMSQ